MSKPANLIGKRFGALTVKERAENNKRGNTMWLCQCDCGNTVVALGYDLTHGRTTSCGCSFPKIGKPSKKRISLVGKRFGRLTVVELSEEKYKNGTLVWKCQCDCGKISFVSGSNLKSGHIQSCGCLSKEQHGNGFKDLTGQKIGKLLVLKESGKIDGKVSWLCRCDCGNEIVVKGEYLNARTTSSCGCLLDDARKRTKYETHKMSKSRLYREWTSMWSRCSDGYHSAKHYKGKGITVCEEWKKFEPFAEWALSNGYKDNLTLDRKDNNKGYYPDNCRWATMKEQQNNRSDNVFIEYMGEIKTMKQWCEYLGLSYGMVKARRRNGWEVPRLFDPPHKKQCK